MNLLLSGIVLAAAAAVVYGGTCFQSDVFQCTMHATRDFYYAGKNMTKLCACETEYSSLYQKLLLFLNNSSTKSAIPDFAGETYLKCLNSLVSCSSSHYYFDAIRILNSRVTIDDCPGLLNLTVSYPPSIIG